MSLAFYHLAIRGLMNYFCLKSLIRGRHRITACRTVILAAWLTDLNICPTQPTLLKVLVMHTPASGATGSHLRSNKIMATKSLFLPYSPCQPVATGWRPGSQTISGLPLDSYSYSEIPALNSPKFLYLLQLSVMRAVSRAGAYHLNHSDRR